MNRKEHGLARAGKVGGTLAYTVMYGTQKAWTSAIKKLWADDGSDYAKPVGGARGHGIAQETVGVSDFWERHPEFDIKEEGWIDCVSGEFTGLIGVSPDRMLYQDGKLVCGLEVKSPTTKDNMTFHILTDDVADNLHHYSQVQHGMLVTNLDRWWHVVHFQKDYHEYCVMRDESWLDKYTGRLRKFLEQLDGAKAAPRHKLRVTDND